MVTLQFASEPRSACKVKRSKLGWKNLIFFQVLCAFNETNIELLGRL